MLCDIHPSATLLNLTDNCTKGEGIQNMENHQILTVKRCTQRLLRKIIHHQGY